MSASPKLDPSPLAPLGPSTTLSRIARVRAPEPPRVSFTPWLAVVLVVVLFSGGLFGYDQGVISGALTGIKSTFALSPLIVEVVTSWVTLGALFGALVGGELADSIGRKRTVLIAGALFIDLSIVEKTSDNTIGRILKKTRSNRTAIGNG